MPVASERPRWPCPTFHSFHRDVDAFRVFGAAGFAAGGITGLGVARLLGVGLGWVGVMFVLAVVTYLALAALATIITGEPVLVFYHHAVAVGLVLAVTLALWERPVLAYLDVFAVSMMAFLSVARLGCLTVGCCHGRPYQPRTRPGAVVYGEAHADAGFPRHLVGVPLFPIQAVEAAGAALLVTGSVTWAAVAQPRPGDLLGVVVVGYALLRYRLEGLRGDPGRVEVRRLTSARLTSVALAVAVVVGAVAGVLPWQAWYLFTAVLLLGAGRRAMANPGPWDLDALLHPDHVADMAVLLELADDQTTPERIALAETSAGVRLSTTTVAFDDPLAHGTVVTLSSARAEPLPEVAAFALGRLLATMRQPEGGASLRPGVAGVFHVVLVDDVGAEVDDRAVSDSTRDADENVSVGAP